MRRISGGRAPLAVFVLATGSVLAFSGTAKAIIAETTYTLSDGNAVTTFNPESQEGEYSFLVNGTQELNQQWFWYRVGDSGPEQSIDSLTLLSATQTGTNILNLDYEDLGVFTIDVNYILTGGAGNGAASLSEDVRVTNLATGASLPLHLFEYDNFTLDGSSTGNVASISGNTATQVGPDGTTATVTATPGPDEYQVGLGGEILGELNDSSATTLDGDGGPTAAGDAEFAFEWDPNIAASGTFELSKLKTITPASAVPIPAAAWTGMLMLAALGTFGLVRRKAAY